MVTVDAGEIVEVAALALDVVRWAVLDVDVAAAGSPADVVDLMQQALAQGAASIDERLLSARIVLQGRTELHNGLVADLENLTAEARAAALGLGDEVAWVERIALQTTPVVDTAMLAARKDTRLSVTAFSRKLWPCKATFNLSSWNVCAFRVPKTWTFSGNASGLVIWLSAS